MSPTLNLTSLWRQWYFSLRSLEQPDVLPNKWHTLLNNQALIIWTTAEINPFYQLSNWTFSRVLTKKRAAYRMHPIVTLTIKHLLIDCADFNDMSRRFYQVPSLQDRFKTLKPEVILDFLTSAALYRLLWRASQLEALTCYRREDGLSCRHGVKPPLTHDCSRLWRQKSLRRKCCAFWRHKAAREALKMTRSIGITCWRITSFNNVLTL